MGKSKKKNKKKSISILAEVDKNLDHSYDNLMEEIQDMQIRLNIADQKARKQAKKKKNAKYFYDTNVNRSTTRKTILQEMENSNFLERMEHMLKDIAPIIVIIARLVASLILAILSLDIVKVNIKPNTLSKMNQVYQKAMSLG